MTLAGFRPALKSEYEEYEFHHRARIAMKPGITGMWQVSGRSDITDFEEVVKLDTEYIKNWSIEALLIINKEKVRISFDVIGPAESEIAHCLNVNDLGKFGIFVHGRMPHEDVLKLVKEADFSVLLRQNKRYAKAGVSTKFCEAMKLGVPSICTQVGGTDVFVHHMQNGILVKDNSVETLTATLQNILKMDQMKILEMKKNAYRYANKEFSKEKYIVGMRKFLSKCE